MVEQGGRVVRGVEDHEEGVNGLCLEMALTTSTQVALARTESYDHIWLPGRQEDAQSSHVPRR